jgi:hypothetical protein
MKIYSMINLMILITHHKYYYFFYICLVKLKKFDSSKSETCVFLGAKGVKWVQVGPGGGNFFMETSFFFQNPQLKGSTRQRLSTRSDLVCQTEHT